MPYSDPDLRRQLDRNRARRRTAERIARGVCARCGKQPPETGRSVCRQCGEKRRLADRAPGPRNASRRGFAPGAAAILTSPTAGSVPPAANANGCATSSATPGARAANLPYGGRNPETKRAQARRRSRNRPACTPGSRAVHPLRRGFARGGRVELRDVP